MQLLALQARAIEGTKPSIVTRALSTNIPKGRPRGEPCTKTLHHHPQLPTSSCLCCSAWAICMCLDREWEGFAAVYALCRSALSVQLLNTILAGRL